MNEIESSHHKTFEDIKQTDEEGNEFWSARQLYPVLEYGTWDKFKYVINKATTSCQNSGAKVEDHFSQLGKMVQLGSGAERNIEGYDYNLSRYACYLIVQNGDPTKPVIAIGQTYFAMQTRRQELADDEKFKQLSEDEKRVMLRNELTEHQKQLFETANKAGVEAGLDFAIFQNNGYQGLYGGRGQKEIHAKKGLKKSHKILDFMGTTELAANLFRATQTEEKIRKDNIQGKRKANATHFSIGRKIRQTIKDIGGTLPEDLPTPERNVKSLEKEQKKKIEKK